MCRFYPSSERLVVGNIRLRWTWNDGMRLVVGHASEYYVVKNIRDDRSIENMEATAGFYQKCRVPGLISTAVRIYVIEFIEAILDRSPNRCIETIYYPTAGGQKLGARKGRCRRIAS
jgi:hypothetical protein